MYVDPIALAALLKLTGPVHVDGLSYPLTSANAAQFLLHDQYTSSPSAATGPTSSRPRPPPRSTP